jgi:hypothetical protein
MSPIQQANQTSHQLLKRRHFLQTCATGMGMMALGSLMGCSSDTKDIITNPYAPKLPHFAGKAKSVIYLHMAGSPSQLELFDFKPELQKWHGKDCPQSFLELLLSSGAFPRC